MANVQVTVSTVM